MNNYKSHPSDGISSPKKATSCNDVVGGEHDHHDNPLLNIEKVA
jgi:hypothetical protein